VVGNPTLKNKKSINGKKESQEGLQKEGLQKKESLTLFN